MKNTKKLFRKLRPLNFSEEFMKRIDKAYIHFERSDLDKMIKQLNKIKSIKNEIKPFLYNTETIDSGSFSMELDYIEKLIKMLKFNCENIGETLLRDKYYDQMLDIYKIYRDEPIEAELITERAEATTTHKFPMLKGTLDKCKYILDENKGPSIQKFILNTLVAYRELDLDEDLIIDLSHKYDGTSVVFEIDKNTGKILDAVTRGKNNKGVSLKKLFNGMCIPEIRDNIQANAVQCEMMISNKDITAYSLEKKLNNEIEEPYKNSRGSVTSIITSLTGHKYAKYLDPVPLRVIYQADNEKQNIEYPPDVVSKCKLAKVGEDYKGGKIEYNHKSVSFSKNLLNSSDMSDYDIFLKIMLVISSEINAIAISRNELPYAIDGAVISVMNEKIKKKLGRKGEINQWQIAYKFKSEEQVTELLDVTYSVNRTGLVIPKAIYEPIIFNGTNQTKATLASREFMNKLHLRKHDKVIIAYANDVIPYFVGVEEHSDYPELKFPTTCPACKHKLKEEGAHSYCTYPQCPPKLVLQFTNFIKVLGFRDFSIEFVSRLVDNGVISSFEDILHLDEKENQMLEIEGIGLKKVKAVKNRLDEIKTNPITSDVLFTALGIAGPKISKNILSSISLLASVKNPEKIMNVEINGVQDSKKTYIDKIKMLNDKGEIERIIKILKPLECSKEQTYKYKVCFSGFRDKELEKKLNEKSIEVVNGLKNILFMVVPNVNHTSRKVTEANNKGIDVIDIEELKNMYDIE